MNKLKKNHKIYYFFNNNQSIVLILNKKNIQITSIIYKFILKTYCWGETLNHKESLD